MAEGTSPVLARPEVLRRPVLEAPCPGAGVGALALISRPGTWPAPSCGLRGALGRAGVRPGAPGRRGPGRPVALSDGAGEGGRPGVGAGPGRDVPARSEGRHAEIRVGGGVRPARKLVLLCLARWSGAGVGPSPARLWPGPPGWPGQAWRGAERLRDGGMWGRWAAPGSAAAASSCRPARGAPGPR